MCKLKYLSTYSNTFQNRFSLIGMTDFLLHLSKQQDILYNFHKWLLLKINLCSDKLMEKDKRNQSVRAEVHCSNYWDFHFHVVIEAPLSCCHIDFAYMT